MQLLKIKYILLTMMFLMSIGLSAQTFKAELIAGGSLAQVDGDTLFGFRQVGLRAGVQVNTILSEKMSVGLGFLYSQQGSRTAKYENPRYYADMQLNFVEVPVMFQIIDWKFEAGLGVAYQRLINYTVINEFDEDVTDEPEFNPNQLHYILDLTFRPQDRWGVNFTYSKALTNLLANKEDGKFINKFISLGLVFYP